MLEVTSRATLDPTIVEGDIEKILSDLNVAAAAGKHFVLMTEVRGSERTPVMLETRNITRVREVDLDAFVGR